MTPTDMAFIAAMLAQIVVFILWHKHTKLADHVDWVDKWVHERVIENYSRLATKIEDHYKLGLAAHEKVLARLDALEKRGE